MVVVGYVVLVVCFIVDVVSGIVVVWVVCVSVVTEYVALVVCFIVEVVSGIVVVWVVCV